MIIYDMPRQSGKTTIIANMMKRNKKSLCIVPTEIQKRYFCKNYEISEKRVFTITEAVMLNKLRGVEHKAVYMDEVGMCLNMLIPKLRFGTNTNYDFELMQEYKGEFVGDKK